MHKMFAAFYKQLEQQRRLQKPGQWSMTHVWPFSQMCNIFLIWRGSKTLNFCSCHMHTKGEHWRLCLQVHVMFKVCSRRWQRPLEAMIHTSSSHFDKAQTTLTPHQQLTRVGQLDNTEPLTASTLQPLSLSMERPPALATTEPVQFCLKLRCEFRQDISATHLLRKVLEA